MDDNLITAGTNILFEAGTNELEILEFYIEEGQGERTHFGINVAKVMQVIEQPPRKEYTHNQHPAFLGVIHLREHALPLIDLSAWLGMARRASPQDVIVVTEFSQAVTGFLVSGVTEIHRVGWDDVAPPEGFLAQMALGCLIGTVRKGEHIIQLLDLESVLADLDPAALAGAGVATVRATHPYRALVADDSPTIRRLIEQNLRAANLVPELAGDGREALTRLLQYKAQAEAAGRPIADYLAIVISDIEMPRLDGFTLTKTLKNDPVLGSLPVILYSSLITEELKHKGVSVGADAQISKPELHRMAERAIALIERG